jgi:diguanylate cyclase (GGDEF)-like protein/hemerythrin-like metal-binding protein
MNAHPSLRQPISAVHRFGDALGAEIVARALIESDAFAVCALDGSRIRYASAGVRVLLGLAPDSPLEGLELESFVNPSSRAALHGCLAAADVAVVAAQLVCTRPDGSTVELRLQGSRTSVDGRSLLIAVLTDASDERRERENLSALAFVDPITGLPNRALFVDHLREALVAATHRQQTFAVLFGDLDGFKQVNDSLGHEAGDNVLRIVAGRLRAVTRSADTIARLGGDEMAVILPSAGTEESAALVAGRMVRAVAEPMSLGGVPANVGISLGIALFPRDGADLDTLMARADGAMYRAKRSGKGHFVFADSENTPPPARHAKLELGAQHEVGWPFMDADHHNLFGLVSAIAEQLKRGARQAELAASIEVLRAEAKAHFGREEDLMRERAYPGLAVHERAHAMLLDDLDSLSVHIDAASMTLTVRYLIDWLLRHVDTLDRGLARWLRGPESEPDSARG